MINDILFMCESRTKATYAFTKMSDGIIKWFYKDTNFKHYKGSRLLSIDGTVLELNNCEKLRDVFGYLENQNAKVARARAAGLYHIENDMIIASTLGKYESSERAQAEELINKLEDIGFSKDLILFDRGFPSRDLISHIERKQIKYLMRAQTQFIKAVDDAKNEDQIIETNHKNKIIIIRVLKFQLHSGVSETLITNIFDENFSGETPIAVEQDFYATMYLSNMVSLAKMMALKGI